jgi:hypothetical protein
MGKRAAHPWRLAVDEVSLILIQHTSIFGADRYGVCIDIRPSTTSVFPDGR